jgi:prophage DNA circulation protein
VNYLKELFIAKFQNRAGSIQFNVESSDFNLGRRVVVHEFVQRDNPFVEDLGRKNRSQTINGFLVANKENNFNPFLERDFLIKLIETDGEGVFTNPFYGELTGHITDFNITETSTKEGGLVAFTFTFIEAGKKVFNGNSNSNNLFDKKASAELSCLASYEAMQTDFNSLFTVENTAGFVRESAINQINSFLEKVNNVVSTQSFTSNINNVALQTYQTIQYAKQQLRQIVFGANLSAVLLSLNIINIIKSINDVTAIKNWAVAPLPTYKTKSRKQQEINNNAIKNLIQTASVVRQGELIINKVGERDLNFNEVTVLTIDDMKVLRTDFSELITNQIYDLSSQYIFDETQSKLVNTRTDILQYLTSQSDYLSRINYTNLCDTTMSQTFTPLIVTAYRHYGELNDELLIERNAIANPLFVPHNQKIAIIN